jgi:hypothetical protein
MSGTVTQSCDVDIHTSSSGVCWILDATNKNHQHSQQHNPFVCVCVFRLPTSPQQQQRENRKKKTKKSTTNGERERAEKKKQIHTQIHEGKKETHLLLEMRVREFEMEFVCAPKPPHTNGC